MIASKQQNKSNQKPKQQTQQKGQTISIYPSAPTYPAPLPPRALQQGRGRKKKPNPRQASTYTVRRQQASMIVDQRPIPAAISTTSTARNFQTTIVRSEQCHPIVLDTDLTRLFDYAINPSNETIFPWLSQVSPFFDMYSFSQLSFRYVPACGVTTVGQITMAIDYDPVDLNVGLQQTDVAAMAGSVTSQLYTPFRLAMNPAACLHTGQNKYYTSSDDSYNDNSRFSHLGRLLTYVSAEPTAKTVYGNLYVDYTVNLFSPQEAGPGYSNNGGVINKTTGGSAVDPLGTVDSASVSSNKPDATGSVNKTRRIVKIISGIATVVGKVAPYIGFIAKLFLTDECPPYAGQFYNHSGVLTQVALADVPCNNMITVRSSQCRTGVIIFHAYGTYTTLVNHSRPVVTMMHSTNITLNNKLQLPTYLCDTLYLPSTPTLATATGIFEFDFNDLNNDKAWFAPVIAQSGTDDIPVWSSQNCYINIFAKVDLPS